MEATPHLLEASAPTAQVNQPAPAVQVNQTSSYSHTEDRKRLPYYNSKAAFATGIIQISCGVLAILLEIIYLSSRKYFYPADKVSVGIWGGALFGVTGYIGILSAKKKRGMVIVYFVLSIVSSVTALVGFLFAIAHILHAIWPYKDVVVVSVLFLIVNVIEGLTAIVASSFGCAARICCSGQAVTQERVIYMAQQVPADAYNGFQVPMGSPPSYESTSPVEEKH